MCAAPLIEDFDQGSVVFPLEGLVKSAAQLWNQGFVLPVMLAGFLRSRAI
jgi:hypothetical protein